MHTAQIKRIGVDAACARIATASHDKTVRAWSLPDGKLQRMIRLPMGLGNGGKVLSGGAFAGGPPPRGRRVGRCKLTTRSPSPRASMVRS